MYYIRNVSYKVLLYNIYLGIVLYIYYISLTNNSNYKTNLDKVIPSFTLEYQISVKSLPTIRVKVFMLYFPKEKKHYALPAVSS